MKNIKRELQSAHTHVTSTRRVDRKNSTPRNIGKGSKGDKRGDTSGQNGRKIAGVIWRTKMI